MQGTCELQGKSLKHELKYYDLGPILIYTYSTPEEPQASQQEEELHRGQKMAPIYSVQMPKKPLHCSLA